MAVVQPPALAAVNADYDDDGDDGAIDGDDGGEAATAAADDGMAGAADGAGAVDAEAGVRDVLQTLALKLLVVLAEEADVQN